MKKGFGDVLKVMNLGKHWSSTEEKVVEKHAIIKVPTAKEIRSYKEWKRTSHPTFSCYVCERIKNKERKAFTVDSCIPENWICKECARAHYSFFGSSEPLR
jgi:hypothetical protein